MIIFCLSSAPIRKEQRVIVGNCRDIRYFDVKAKGLVSTTRVQLFKIKTNGKKNSASNVWVFPLNREIAPINPNV